MQQNDETYDESRGHENPLVFLPSSLRDWICQYDRIIEKGTGAVAQHFAYLIAMTSKDSDVTH